MRYVLMVVGYGWALLGFLNCIGSANRNADGSDASAMVFGVAFVVNSLLFVLPGLLIGFIGQYIGRRDRARKTDDERVQAAVQEALAVERARKVPSDPQEQ